MIGIRLIQSIMFAQSTNKVFNFLLCVLQARYKVITDAFRPIFLRSESVATLVIAIAISAAVIYCDITVDLPKPGGAFSAEAVNNNRYIVSCAGS